MALRDTYNKVRSLVLLTAIIVLGSGMVVKSCSALQSGVLQGRLRGLRTYVFVRQPDSVAFNLLVGLWFLGSVALLAVGIAGLFNLLRAEQNSRSGLKPLWYGITLAVMAYILMYVFLR